MQIDYKLFKKSERKEHSPNKALKVIDGPGVYRITGDNSLGKTFILNLIAYGLFLDKTQSKTLDEQVFNSIDKYNNREEYELSYSIDFTLNGDRGICLSRENSGEREVEIDGRSYGPEALATEIDVVYDLPKNPIERIKDVVKSVQDWNSSLEERVGLIFRSLGSINHRLASLRDDDLIKELQKNIDEYEKSRDRLQEKIESLEKKAIDYSAWNMAKSYQKTLGELRAAKLELAKAENDLKKIPKPKQGATQSQSLLNSYRSKVNEELKAFKDNPIDLSDLINRLSEYTDCKRVKDYSRHIDVKVAMWDFDYLFTDDWFDELNDVRHTIKNSLDDLVAKAEAFLDDDRFKEGQKVKDLLVFLKSLDSDKTTVEILDKNLKTGFQGFVKELQESLAHTKEAEIVNSIIADCKGAKNSLEQRSRALQHSVISYSAESKKSPTSNDRSYHEALARRDEAREKEKGLQRDKDHLNFELHKLIDKDPDSYEDITALVGELYSRLDRRNTEDSIDSELIQAKSEKNTLDFKIGNQKRRLNDEKEKEVLKLSPSSRDSLKHINMVFRLIRNNLLEFREPIKAYRNNQNLTPTSDEDRAFLSIIGKMIAESINNEIVREGGERMEVLSFDLASRKFECADGSAIPVGDVSRGISSATYLVQVVNRQSSDNVILLLDEMGEITDTTFEVVHDAIKRLSNDGKTVYAFATRAVDGQPLKIERL